MTTEGAARQTNNRAFKQAQAADDRTAEINDFGESSGAYRLKDNFQEYM